MADSLSLLNQNLLVTGVSRSLGIGTAIAKRLSQAGAVVAVHGNANYDSDRNYPDASVSHISKLASSESTLKLCTSSDLSDPAVPEQVVAEAVKKTGPLHGLVLNHAYSTNASVMDWTAEHIDAHLSVNVRASMLLIQAFVKQLPQDSKGVITLFTSGQYLGPMIDEIAYAVSKEAIRGLCTQLSTALAPKNIRVNCINPGPTDTGYLEGEAYEQVARMFPAGKWGTPDDAAKLVQFLHSEQAQWITGQTIASEGGFERQLIMDNG